jgi:hypothetical protein
LPRRHAYGKIGLSRYTAHTTPGGTVATTTKSQTITYPTNQCGVTRTQVLTTGTYLGRGEFYSGLGTGDRVTVSIDTYTHSDGHATEHITVRGDGAWLSVYRGEEVEVDA